MYQSASVLMSVTTRRPCERARFDPIAEGKQYRLPGDLLREIWKWVCADATDRAGGCDEAQAQQEFHDIAADIAAQRRLLRPGRAGTAPHNAERPAAPPRQLAAELPR